MNFIFSLALIHAYYTLCRVLPKLKVQIVLKEDFCASVDAACQRDSFIVSAFATAILFAASLPVAFCLQCRLKKICFLVLVPILRIDLKAALLFVVFFLAVVFDQIK